MKTATLIVCERNGAWAAAWRQSWSRRAEQRASSLPDVRCLETRSGAECLERLADAPAAVVLVELTAASSERSLSLLSQIALCSRQALAVVAAERQFAPYEWTIRELGAVHFLVSPRELPALCGLVERHAARAPEIELELEDGIWAELPWGE
jgi:hypothetical protein